MRKSLVVLAATLCAIAPSIPRSAFAMGPNDYNDTMVYLHEVGFAACVGGKYRHDIRWESRPATCCGWHHTKMDLYYDDTTSAMDVPVDWRPFMQDIDGPGCAIVSHNKAFRMHMYGYATAQTTIPQRAWVVSNMISTFPPVSCNSSQ
jgi:hypothetical protein